MAGPPARGGLTGADVKPVLPKLTEAQWAIAWRMSERQLQYNVLDAAKKTGAKWAYHTHDSRRSEAGMPDLIIITRDLRVLYWELKREGDARRMRTWNRMAPPYTKDKRRWADQLRVIGLLRRSGAPARIIRPRDWLRGYVERLLDGPSPAEG
jgi:hypothetical protein